ncbi:MAG: hypothetical protein JNL61_05130 [Rhizobiaceae bacterium]|nr:hypothetical protein [Rhizobiaceae bacterium]
MREMAKPTLLAVLLAAAFHKAAHAQQTQPPQQNPCAVEDYFCEIVTMDPKPGAGGGGGGVTNAERPPDAYINDLGADRLTTEEMRLPSFKDSILMGVQGQN